MFTHCCCILAVSAKAFNWGMGRVEGQVLLLRGGLKLQFQFLSRPLMWSGSTHSPNRNLTLPPYPTFSMLSFLFLAFHKERALFFHHFFYLSISLSLSPPLSPSPSLFEKLLFKLFNFLLPALLLVEASDFF